MTMVKRQHISPIGDEGLYILDTGSWRNYRPVINRERCVNCGVCFTFCPVGSIVKPGAGYEINLQYCKGCGICAHECPRKAIDMVFEGGQD